MAFDSAGTFTRIRGDASWQGDATAGTPIKADLHDINDKDLADGLTQCITKNGATQPTSDIPMNGHKLVNVGQPADPQDAATKRYVDETPGWPTAKNISGSGVDGRLNFTSLTGANGITWSNIGAAWLARPFIVDKERNRVVLNNAVDGSGTDVVSIDEADGIMNFPSQFLATTNLIYDGSTPTASWRTPSAGTGGLLQYVNQSFNLTSNFTATTVAYGQAALETWFQAYRSGGTVAVILNKKAGAYTNIIYGNVDGVNRWLLQLGDGTAEDGTFHGSNFVLTSCNNSGTQNFTAISISRANGKVQLPQGITGILTLDNGIDTVGTPAVLGGVGGVYLRPNGRASTTGQTIVTAAGDLNVTRYVSANGYAECGGTSGSPNIGQLFNFLYVSSTDIRAYVGTSFVGTWTPACDYRIKREVQLLPSSWEKVKALRPVKYLDAAYGDEKSVFKDGDTERWGFLAHELQDALLPSAATGEHDGPDLQVPSHITVIAALTSALQEAMLRIEALESRP